jgi:rod shape-determining protein MreC
MRHSFFPHSQTILLVVLLVGSFVAISLQVRDPSGEPYFTRGVMSALAPAQAGVDAVLRAAGTVWAGYLGLVGVRAENARLRDQAAALESEVALLREEVAQAGRLEEFAEFRRRASLTGVTARVVGESSDPWMQAVAIDRGSADGVRRGMPVVTPRGVVGRVTQAGERSSMVTLVTDTASAVPVLVAASRSRAILEGENSGTCSLKYLERTAEVKVGDAVVTSGLGGVFPPGLTVGTVSQVLKKESGLYQYAKVLPTVPLRRLEDVVVLTEASGSEGR